MADSRQVKAVGCRCVSDCNVVNNRQLRWVARMLPRRNNKWYAAIEQSGLSANNFFYTLVIVKFASIGDLGVYTFWFVVCQFMAMLTMGLATRQMVLEHASKSSIDQIRGLRTTCLIVLALQAVQVALLYAFVQTYPPHGHAFLFWLALTVYCISFNFAELFRQFYYMFSQQRLSLYFSTISLGCGALLFLVFAASGTSDALELSAFWFLASGNLFYIVCTNIKLRQRILSAGSGSESTSQLFQRYNKHGVPATGGMLVTWMQNQSVTPLLMFMFGPVVVGYFSIARMIVTPVNMVTTGLAKSALPQIRKVYEADGHSALLSAVRGHRRIGMRTAFFYFILVGIAVVAARFFALLQVNDYLIAMLLATALVTCFSNYRFWISQYFVVRMQFKTLLHLGIFASCITVTIMLIGGLFFNSTLLVVTAPACGEVILIYALSRLLVKFSESK